MKKSTQKVFDCISEMYKDVQHEGWFKNASAYINAHGANAALSAAMKELGIITEINRGKYTWNNGEPTETTALRLVDYMNERVKKQAKEKTLEKYRSLDPLIDELYEYFAECEKYGIPKDKRKEYVKDQYLKKHKK